MKAIGDIVPRERELLGVPPTVGLLVSYGGVCLLQGYGSAGARTPIVVRVGASPGAEMVRACTNS